MGIIKRGILGGFSGSVANVVGTSWKGRAVIKSKPLSVANPRTTAQTNQRSKFSAIVGVAKQITTSILQPLWNRFSGDISGYNMFIKKNLPAGQTDGSVNFTALKMSEGDLAKSPEILSFSFEKMAKNASITWIPTLEGNASGDDEAYLVVIDQTSGNVIAAGSNTTRSTGTMNLTTTDDFTDGGILFAYLMFRKADGTMVSDSDYTTGMAG